MPSLTEVVAGRPEVVGETIDGDLASGERLEGVTFVGCRLTGSLARSVIAGCRFERCTVEQVDLSGARLPDTVLDACTFVEADLDGAVLRGARLDGCDLRGARVIRCDLREADLRGSHSYVIDPRENEVAGLTVDLTGSLGLLAPFGLEVD